MVLLSPLALEHNLLTSMEIDVPTTEPVVLESGVENTLIPSEEGDFLITVTSDRGVPVVKLTEDEKTLAEGSSLVNREFKAHLKAAGDLTVTESLSGTALGVGQRAAVASFQIPTGGDAGTFKGTAVITFVGNIA